ncbi:EamA family transporter [Paratractidigestivibacter sp.]|uniref:EamA family transporter n=1 Tax=Paratractidigestivibacter sp. TaxID=2847316 RepID=UPI002ABDC18D|nr:EamA family transporter [Paratractidigestivibacter sp.]
MNWVLAAAASALFAGLTSVLAKVGIAHTDSDVATAVRCAVVLLFSWVMAAISVGDVPAALAQISPRSYAFLALSGLATGGSWICYFAALAEGDVNKVVPIDKSSTALSALLAIVFFGETGHLGVKLAAIAAILAGTLMMVEKRRTAGAPAGQGRRWVLLAVAAAVFAALTSVLAKVGVSGVDSNLATAVRTCVVLVMAWAIVAARGKLSLVRRCDHRELGFICASGVATGASWLFYYYAIQAGQVSVVTQIDKLSILVSIGFARAVFTERLGRRAAAGLALIVAATLAMTVWS